MRAIDATVTRADRHGLVRGAWVLALGLAACEGASSRPDAADPAAVKLSAADEGLVAHTFDHIEGLPRVRIHVPRFVRPFTITDPPVVVMFREARPVDQPFHAAVALQPARHRGSEPHCGLVGMNPRQTEPVREVPGTGRQILRCTSGDPRGVIVDRRIVDALSGHEFFCIAHWWWDGPGPIADRWKPIATAIEGVCDDLDIPLPR